MLRTEVYIMKCIGDIHYSKKGDLEEYIGDIRKRWNIFEQ